MAATNLYRHFNAAGELLYVGISLHAMQRMRHHEANSHWFDDVETMKVETFDDRRSAMRAERDAIKSECPKFNKTHANKKKKPQESANKFSGMGISITVGERRMVSWMRDETGVSARGVFMSLVRDAIKKSGGNIREIQNDETLDR